MATLSADTPRVFEPGRDNMVNSLPMIDNDIIYDGAAVGESGTTGTFRPLVAGDNFGGFCTKNADNTKTGHAAGAVNVDVNQQGRVTLSVTGVSSIADIGCDVYASDDNTFTLTAGSNTWIGKVARWESSTNCVVTFVSNTMLRTATLGNLSDGGVFQGTRTDSATQNYVLGTKRVYGDGRTFRYVKARTALHTEFGACYAAKTITNAVAPVQGTGAGAIGDFKVTVTVASGDGLATNGAIAANELVGGYIVCGNGTSQHPQNRQIVANTVIAAGGGSITVTVDEALDAVVTAGATNIEVLMNPWILSDGNVTNSGYVTFRGMPACELTLNHFGWIQTAGPCWITSDGNTCNSDGDRQIYFANNGSCVSGNDVTGDINVQQLAGHAIDMSSSGSSNAPFVNLMMEVS